MNQKNAWIVASAILTGTIIFSMSNAFAQRDFRTEPRPTDGAAHCYQVVNVTDGEIIIMDVTTGGLYSAKPHDVKPYDSRPRPNAAYGVFHEKNPLVSVPMERAKDKAKFDEKGPWKDKLPGIPPPRFEGPKEKDKK